MGSFNDGKLTASRCAIFACSKSGIYSGCKQSRFLLTPAQLPPLCPTTNRSGRALYSHHCMTAQDSSSQLLNENYFPPCKGTCPPICFCTPFVSILAAALGRRNAFVPPLSPSISISPVVLGQISLCFKLVY